jgi:SAM-dependent methyltransferase
LRKNTEKAPASSRATQRHCPSPIAPSSAVAVLVLHHLRSSELQDRAFAEVHRVLQPGGCFLAFEIPDGWFNRIIHTNSTFVPLQPAALTGRLTSAGFAGVTLDHRAGGFRFCASRKN